MWPDGTEIVSTRQNIAMTRTEGRHLYLMYEERVSLFCMTAFILSSDYHRMGQISTPIMRNLAS